MEVENEFSTNINSPSNLIETINTEKIKQNDIFETNESKRN